MLFAYWKLAINDKIRLCSNRFAAAFRHGMRVGSPVLPETRLQCSYANIPFFHFSGEAGLAFGVGSQ